jgi:hypothetical protein
MNTDVLTRNDRASGVYPSNYGRTGHIFGRFRSMMQRGRRPLNCACEEAPVTIGARPSRELFHRAECGSVAFRSIQVARR